MKTVDLSVLVSKIRYELLHCTKEVVYVSGLFGYFNGVYGELHKEQETVVNPAGQLKTKKEFSQTGNAAINQLFEKVFVTLRDQREVERYASSEFMLLYALGFEVQHRMGKLNELNKNVFFKELINLYNHDFHSNFTSLEDFMLSKKSRKDFDDLNDY
jgi:hypothetical protein